MSAPGPACPTCGRAQSPDPAATVLYLCPPGSHGATTIMDVLRRHGELLDPATTDACIGCRFDPDRLPGLLDELASRLTGPIQRATRTLLAGDGEAVGLNALARMTDLATLAAQVNARWLADLIDERRLTTFFHGIWPAADTCSPYAYECLSRGLEPGGGIISPGRLFGAASSAGMLFPLDRLARETAVMAAHQKGITTRLFINFTPTALYDPATCLATTVKAVDSTGLPRDRFVFEVIETEEIDDADHLVGILQAYRDSGFGIALDDLGGGYSGLNLLSRLRPDFVKLDREMIMGIDTDTYRQVVVGHVIEMARDLNVRVVAEGVETAAELDWLRLAGTDLVQGFLFGKPQPDPVAAPGA